MCESAEDLEIWGHIYCFDECKYHKITHQQYLQQLDQPFKPWYCPVCGGEAELDALGDCLSEG